MSSAAVMIGALRVKVNGYTAMFAFILDRETTYVNYFGFPVKGILFKMGSTLKVKKMISEECLKKRN